jgi:DNA gyrase subunit A
MLVRMDENDTVMGFDLVDPSDLDRCAPSGE